MSDSTYHLLQSDKDDPDQDQLLSTKKKPPRKALSRYLMIASLICCLPVLIMLLQSPFRHWCAGLLPLYNLAVSSMAALVLMILLVVGPLLVFDTVFWLMMINPLLVRYQEEGIELMGEHQCDGVVRYAVGSKVYEKKLSVGKNEQFVRLVVLPGEPSSAVPAAYTAKEPFWVVCARLGVIVLDFTTECIIDWKIFHLTSSETMPRSLPWVMLLTTVAPFLFTWGLASRRIWWLRDGGTTRVEQRSTLPISEEAV